MDKVNEIMKQWNALQPLSERDRELLSRRFTIDFNYNSNHIEGNTLTYGQTEILLLFGKIIGEAEVKDVQEMTDMFLQIDNSKDGKCAFALTGRRLSTHFIPRVSLRLPWAMVRLPFQGVVAG